MIFSLLSFVPLFLLSCYSHAASAQSSARRSVRARLDSDRPNPRSSSYDVRGRRRDSTDPFGIVASVESAVAPLATSTTTAKTAESSSSTSSGCPAVWTTIADDLQSDFAGCNNRASSAVRFGFHDAAGYSSKNTPYDPASGGADGSLLLNDEEISRSAENPLQTFRDYLKSKWDTCSDQDVSAADFVQFAASLGVRSCPGGPVVKTVVGRKDTDKASPTDNLPAAFGANATHDFLIQLWGDKGISPRELGALMGAHSISRAFAQVANGIPSGTPQDSTPTKWDSNYYNQTQAENAPLGVGRFDSDVNLGRPGTTCGAAFTEFAGNFDAWSTAYSAAAFKMSVMGISESEMDGFVDCTDIISNVSS